MNYPKINTFIIKGPTNTGKTRAATGRNLPISFASRSLNKAETHYTTSEKELLAIVYALKYFRPYLYGHRFKIVTDHKPLTWVMNVKDPGSRLLR
jgi:hypothetical protein